MKKIVIPAILAATILVAAAFAIMPVEKATTVHTTITSTLAKKGVLVLGTQAVGTFSALDLGAGNVGLINVALQVTTACTGTGTLAVTGTDANGNTITLVAAAVQGTQNTFTHFIGRSVQGVVATAALASCVGTISAVGATGS